MTRVPAAQRRGEAGATACYACATAFDAGASALIPEPIFAGVETGGAKVLCKVVDRSGATLAEGRFATGRPQAAVEAIAACVGSVLSPVRRLAGVGVAGFGPIDLDPESPGYGRMLATPKPHWSGFDLRGALAHGLDAPVRIDTDVNAAALAEQRMGAGRGLETMAYVTVGSGIGAGLVIGGRTLRGAMHPEMGHLRLERCAGDERPSACPFHANCAEGLSAGPALRHRLGDRTLEDAPEVFALASDYLAQLCEAIVLAWSPQRLILSGGVMSTPGLRASVHEELRRRIRVYGPVAAVEPDGYLAAPELEHSGLEGAVWMAMTPGL